MFPACSRKMWHVSFLLTGTWFISYLHKGYVFCSLTGTRFVSSLVTGMLNAKYFLFPDRNTVCFLIASCNLIWILPAYRICFLCATKGGICCLATYRTSLGFCLMAGMRLAPGLLTRTGYLSYCTCSWKPSLFLIINNRNQLCFIQLKGTGYVSYG